MLGKAKKAFTPITMGIVLTIMVGAAPAAAATKRPLLHATYSKLCTVAEQLKATPKRASKLLGSLTQAADVATQMAVKFRIGAAADPKAHKTATALAVTSILEKKAEALLQSLKTEAAKAVTAATTTTALRARIAEGLQTFAAAKVNAGYCLDSQATNSDGHTAFATSACLKDDLQVEAADAKWPAGKLKTDGFTDGPTSSGPVSSDSGTDSQCALTHTGTSAGTNCFPQNAKLIAATLTLNAGPSSTMRDLTQNLQQSNRQDNKLIEAALEDANLLDAADVTQYEAEPEKALKKIVTKQQLIKELQSTLIFSGSKDKQGAQAAAEAEANKLTDTDSKELVTLWNKLQDTDVQESSEAYTSEKKIKTIGSTSELLKILAYYQGREAQRIRALEEENARLNAAVKAAAKKSEQICNAIQDEKNCGNNENCKYDKDNTEGPKCVLSDKGKKEAAKEAETQETAKDGKTTTQTPQEAILLSLTRPLFGLQFFS